jgi:peptidoglycan/xylan/chitin deacetylase (PgdA/CDA1 family)
VYAPFDLAAAYDVYVSESWAAATRQRRLSTRQLDAFYAIKRFIPRPLQLAIRRLLVRWQGVPTFPAWPLDRSVVRLLHLYAFCVLCAQDKSEAPFRWFWPRHYRAAITLTHDVEGQEGLRLALGIADLEEELGFRSSFNLGGWYRPDPGLVRELTRRGFEIGVHGLRHDRSLFANRASFEAQQRPLRDLIKQLGAVGFRSPATHRVFEWIGELPVDYDCSMPHSDPFEPQPGGCCSVWPFFIGPVVELPYTLPQDHTLFTLLGHRTPDLWIEQATRIEKDYGLIECLTHPDRGYLGNARERGMYAEFLRSMAERPHVWRALPRDVAKWWRSRDLGKGDVEYGLVRVGGEPDEVTLEPPVVP